MVSNVMCSLKHWQMNEDPLKLLRLCTMLNFNLKLKTFRWMKCFVIGMLFSIVVVQWQSYCMRRNVYTACLWCLCACVNKTDAMRHASIHTQLIHRRPTWYWSNIYVVFSMSCGCFKFENKKWPKLYFGENIVVIVRVAHAAVVSCSIHSHIAVRQSAIYISDNVNIVDVDRFFFILTAFKMLRFFVWTR